MNVPPLYLSLGLSQASRKRRLYGRMEKRAAANAMKGLSTRIPFLKQAVCGMDAPKGESVKSEPIRLDKSAPEGHEFRLRSSIAALLRLRGFWDDLTRFNSCNASRGLQAIGLQKLADHHLIYRVTSCKISYLGDLRIALVTGDGSGLFIGAGGGIFFSSTYGVFLNDNDKFYSRRHRLLHETEHAQHLSLWRLAGFPDRAVDQESTEYLAMLRTLRDIGEAPQLTSCGNEFLRLMIPSSEKPRPHDAAAVRFAHRLMGRYKMSELEVAMGISWSIRDTLAPETREKLHVSFAEQFVRMRNAAMGEYNETYARMFGMPLDDLREVVSRLSV